MHVALCLDGPVPLTLCLMQVPVTLSELFHGTWAKKWDFPRLVLMWVVIVMRLVLSVSHGFVLGERQRRVACFPFVEAATSVRLGCSAAQGELIKYESTIVSALSGTFGNLILHLTKYLE